MTTRELLDTLAAYGGCVLAVLAFVVALGAAFALGWRLSDLVLRVLP